MPDGSFRGTMKERLLGRELQVKRWRQKANNVEELASAARKAGSERTKAQVSNEIRT
jgi:hypothetical protein